MYYLDIDGVLANTFAQVMEEVSILLGKEAKPNLVSSYNRLYRAWPGQEAKAKRHIETLFDSSWFYQRVRPIRGAARAVTHLAGVGRLAGYMTSRPPYTQESTLMWLRAYGFVEAPVFFTRDKAQYLGVHGGVLVDDNPATVRACLNRRKRAILYLAPYNVEGADGLETISNLWELTVPNEYAV